jgi:hypothetical protein
LRHLTRSSGGLRSTQPGAITSETKRTSDPPTAAPTRLAASAPLSHLRLPTEASEAAIIDPTLLGNTELAYGVSHQPIPITMPQSPFFALEDRSHVRDLDHEPLLFRIAQIVLQMHSGDKSPLALHVFFRRGRFCRAPRSSGSSGRGHDRDGHRSTANSPFGGDGGRCAGYSGIGGFLLADLPQPLPHVESKMAASF